MLAITSCAFGFVLPVAGAKPQKGYFVPGVSIVPNVFEPDGQTLRTYHNDSGSTLWSPEIPIKQGDKLELKIFATTGGSELAKLIVRLDNVKIADLTAAPWTALIDTGTLTPGSHMVEAWAQAGNNPANAVTKTLSFVVEGKVPQQETISSVGSTVIEPDQPGGPSVSGVPDVPSFLSKKTVDDNAGLTIRSEDSDVDRVLSTGDQAVTVSTPATIYCERTPGSRAVNYAYALVRDGKVIISSKKPESLQYVKIRLQPLDNGQGLLPGTISLWVWGIDKQGAPSNPVHHDFVIPAVATTDATSTGQ